MRINPDELHCSDYDFVNEIYPSVGSRIRDKSPHFIAGFAGTLTVSSFGTSEHEVHLVVSLPFEKAASNFEMSKVTSGPKKCYQQVLLAERNASIRASYSRHGTEDVRQVFEVDRVWPCHRREKSVQLLFGGHDLPILLWRAIW